MIPVRWGVMVAGSWVEESASALAAFRREAEWSGEGVAAVAVYSTHGRVWLAVSRSSVLRPDPEPPVAARRVWLWERWFRRPMFRPASRRRRF